MSHLPGYGQPPDPGRAPTSWRIWQVLTQEWQLVGEIAEQARVDPRSCSDLCKRMMALGVVDERRIDEPYRLQFRRAEGY